MRSFRCILSVLIAVSTSNSNGMCAGTPLESALSQGKASFAQKDYSQAEKSFLEADDVLKKSAPRSLTRARLLKNIATVKLYQHKRAEALSYFEQAADILLALIKQNPKATNMDFQELSSCNELAVQQAEKLGDTGKAAQLRKSITALLSVRPELAPKQHSALSFHQEENDGNNSEEDSLRAEREQLEKEKADLRRQKAALANANQDSRAESAPTYVGATISTVLKATPEELARLSQITTNTDYMHGTSTSQKGKLPGRLVDGCRQLSNTYHVNQQDLQNRLESGQAIIELSNNAVYVSSYQGSFDWSRGTSVGLFDGDSKMVVQPDSSPKPYQFIPISLAGKN